jgi:peptidase C25-like protein
MKTQSSKCVFRNSAILILCLFSVGVVAGAGVRLGSGSVGTRASGTANSTTARRVAHNLATQASLGMATSAAPTAATLETFSAARYDGGVFIQWRTGYEIDNLGFRLYRVERGKRVLITPQMLAGSALVTGQGTPLTAGKSYAWWDNASKGKDPSAYWLEELDLKGQSIWHGPATAKLVSGSPPEQARAAQLAGLGRTDAPSRPVQTWATPAKLAAGKSPSSFGLASQFAIKILVNHEGWYRVTQAELLAAGLASNTDPRNLQLFLDGQPLAISVIGESDGKLDSGDAVEFYGVGANSPQTDTLVYWLAGGATPGLRITSAPSAAPPTAGGSFPFTIERRDRTIYFSGLLNGEIENFFGAVIASQPVNQSLTVTNMDAAASGGSLEVALQGVTFVSHQVNVALNGVPLGTLVFSSHAAGVATFAVAPGVLQQGANQVTLAVAGGGGDVSLVDHLRLTYNHTYTADNDFLKLAAVSNQQITIGGFSANTIRVFDITNAASVQEVSGQVQQQGASYGVSLFVPGTGPRVLLALSGGRIGPAKQVVANLPSNWSKAGQGADFLIITPRDFFSAVEQLRVTRQSQGLSVAVVDIEDVYDEFSFGQKTTQAIKDFLAFARNSWKKGARYALFVGDASYDARNYLGFGDFDLVPTKLIDTIFMEASSDDWLADFNGDGIPELSLGRLPVRTGEETERLIAKILGYDESIPPDELLLVADANDEYDFEGASGQLHPFVPGDVRAVDLHRGQMTAEAAKAALLDAIARGQRYVNYTGHGNVNQWHGDLLTNEDAAVLDNADHLPVFLMMTCLNGYFNDPALDSIAEKLLMNPRGGAVAVWTSTGQTFPGGQWAINQELYVKMFSAPQVRIGDAARAAKLATTDMDVRLTWILFGDPTMRLR